MNDFLYEELLNKEYHRNKEAEAMAYNQATHINKSKVTILIYWLLSKLGVVFENIGCKMRVRYEGLATQNQRNAIPSLAK